MNRTLASFLHSAMMGILIVLPFAGMELMNRQNLHSTFPADLFVFLWFLAALFLILVKPLIHSEQRNVLGVAQLWLRIPALLCTGALWCMIVIDQMPCFLGLGNCD